MVCNAMRHTKLGASKGSKRNFDMRTALEKRNGEKNHERTTFSFGSSFSPFALRKVSLSCAPCHTEMANFFHFEPTHSFFEGLAFMFLLTAVFQPFQDLSAFEGFAKRVLLQFFRCSRLPLAWRKFKSYSSIVSRGSFSGFPK